MAKTLIAKVENSESPPRPSADSANQITANVLKALGKPHDLLRVQVKSLWQNHFRANVFTGTGHAATIAHSFFLETTPDGAIVSSSPAIECMYPAA